MESPFQLAQRTQTVQPNRNAPRPIRLAGKLMSWEALGVVVPLLLAVGGWYLVRRKQGRFKNYFEKIDATFHQLKTETGQCEAELYHLQEGIDEELAKGKLDEGTYHILTKRIERYLKEIKKSALILFLFLALGYVLTSSVSAQSRSATTPPALIPIAPLAPLLVVPISTPTPPPTGGPTTPPRITPTPVPTVTPTATPTSQPTTQPTSTPTPTPLPTPSSKPLIPPLIIPLAPTASPSPSPTSSPSASSVATVSGSVAGIFDEKPVTKNPWGFVVASCLMSWVLLRRIVRIERKNKKAPHRRLSPLGFFLFLPLISELYELFNNYRDVFGGVGKEES